MFKRKSIARRWQFCCFSCSHCCIESVLGTWFYPTYNCKFFLDAGRRHETHGSETEDFIITIMMQNKHQCFCINVPSPRDRGPPLSTCLVPCFARLERTYVLRESPFCSRQKAMLFFVLTSSFFKLLPGNTALWTGPGKEQSGSSILDKLSKMYWSSKPNGAVPHPHPS
jgi:hypothetical protein